MKLVTVVMICVLATGVICSSTVFASTNVTPKVVYDLSQDGSSQTIVAFREIHNQLETAPLTNVVVVVHGGAVKNFVNDKKNPRTEPLRSAISSLLNDGVIFEICNVALLSQKIKRDTLVPGVKVIPSGVVEITNLQATKGFAYIKP